jgi:hypothetical protein
MGQGQILYGNSMGKGYFKMEIPLARVIFTRKFHGKG